MADISVTLVLDDSQFQGTLKKVDSAVNTSADNIKKKGQEMGDSFDKVGKNVSDLGGKLNSLSSSLAGVGFGAFILGAINAGASAADAAEKFGVTTQSMLEINKSASAVGVSSEKVSTAMNKMLKGAQDAADGNMKLRDAFNTLGASNEYFRTHSADETFNKLVHSLAAIEDPAQRAQKAMEIFGRGAANIDLAKLAAELDKNNGTMGEAAEAAEHAQATMENLKAAFAAVQIEVLKILDPLTKMVGDEASGFKGAHKAALMVIEAFAALSALGMAKVIFGIGEAVVALTGELYALATAEAAATGGLSTIASFLVKLGVGAAAAYVAAEGVDAVTNKVDEATKAVDKNTEAEKKNADAKNLKNKAMPAMTEGNLNPGAGAEQSLKNQFNQLQLNNDLALKRLDLETQLVGQTEAVRASKLAEFDADAAYQRKRLELQGQIAKLQAEQANTRGGGNFGGQIAILKQELASYESQADAIKAKTKALTDAKVTESMNLEILKAEKKMVDELSALQLEYTEYGMTADEKKLANLKKQYDQALENVKVALQGKYGSAYDVTGTDEFKDAQKKLGDQLKLNEEQMKKNIEQSRDFATAWDGAIKQYQDDATNGAKLADNAFKSFSSNIENYLESMVTKGKFSFQDMTNAIITDIIKMEIKAATSSLFSMFGSTGGTGGSMTGLMSFFGIGGKASGGTVGPNEFSLVGENGPELIKGPATVTNAANTESMLGGQNVTHNYNINAIDSKSMAQMFQENRMTMFAYTEQARRELPMRTR